MAVIIRAATTADLPRIEELWIELVDLHNNLDRRHCRRAADGPAIFRQWVEQAFADAERAVFVAERAGTVAGYGHCCLKNGPPPMQARLEGFITDLVVEESARRQGIGARLVDACEEWSAEHGAEGMSMMVATRNGAGVAFWRSRGFEDWMAKMWKPLRRQ